MIYSENSDSENEESSHESEEDNDGSEDEKDDEFAVSADAKYESVEKDTTVAVYSPPTSIELFFLVHVVDIGIAAEDMEDQFGHVVEKGYKFIRGYYMEYDGEKKGHGVIYKKIMKLAFIFPHQLFSICVPISPYKNDRYLISLSDYQFLSDSI